MPKYTRNTIPDKPPVLPHKRPEDNPGRNMHSDKEKMVRTVSHTKHNPTVKSGNGR
jgi:hypothetical protein